MLYIISDTRSRGLYQCLFNSVH